MATLAERLDVVVKKFNPKAAPGRASYVILTERNGDKRVVVHNEEGDRISGTGKNTAEAITNLEARVNG